MCTELSPRGSILSTYIYPTHAHGSWRDQTLSALDPLGALQGHLLPLLGGEIQGGSLADGIYWTLQMVLLTFFICKRDAFCRASYSYCAIPLPSCPALLAHHLDLEILTSWLPLVTVNFGLAS